MMIIGGIASAAVAPMAFSARYISNPKRYLTITNIYFISFISLIDIPIVFILGALLTWVKVSGVIKKDSFGFILEISCACIISVRKTKELITIMKIFK